MRRAVPALALAALAGVLAAVPVAHAQTPDLINAIGLVDFGNKPDFRVGSWAKYHMKGQGAKGVVDDYTVTVLIAGEERWWGEECFWVETQTQGVEGGLRTVASLMSYEIFKDSLAVPHMQYYVRKVINGVGLDGNPTQEVYKRPGSTLKARETPTSQFRVKVDTLGQETISLTSGVFECKKVQLLQGRGATGSQGDSTDYTELKETRTVFVTPRVPITHIAREDVDQRMTRKAWKIGKSDQATPTVVLDEVRGSAVLVEMGQGRKAALLPESMQKSLAELDARPVAPARKTPATRPRTTTRKSG